MLSSRLQNYDDFKTDYPLLQQSCCLQTTFDLLATKFDSLTMSYNDQTKLVTILNSGAFDDSKIREIFDARNFGLTRPILAKARDANNNIRFYFVTTSAPTSLSSLIFQRVCILGSPLR